MQVAVQLLGSFAVEIDGRKVPPDAWGRRHAAWLVKLLALAPGRQLHRDQVLDQLWPEAPPDDAAGRLHKAAHYARRAADCAEIVVLRRELVALAPGADVSVDADAFEEASTEALRTGDPERLEAALALYTGELLPEDRYAEWSLPHRNRLALRHRELLRAVGRWPTLIELDPTDEEAYIGLMREDLERGDRTAVRRTFDQLAEVLSRELGIGPSPEAVELRDRALAGQDDLAPITAPRHAGLATQSIRFLRSFDDVRIAYAVSGSGPPLVKTPNWLTG